MSEIPSNTRTFLRETDLVGPSGLFPFSRSTLWLWVRAGDFPAPTKFGPRITVWERNAVLAWIASRQKSSEGRSENGEN